MADTIKQLSQFRWTLSLSLLACVLFAIEIVVPASGPFLEYESTRSPLGQIPNLFSCHWLHWSGEHLFWDLGMFGLLCGLCERICRRTLVLLLMSSSMLIPVAVGLYHPEIATYRGLSGLDTALFGMAVVYLGLQRMKESDLQGVLIYFALLAAMVAKTIHELNFGTLFVESSNFIPVPVAHIVGALTGISIGVWQHFRELDQSAIAVCEASSRQ